MLHNLRILQAILYCPYKSWQLSKDASEPDSSLPILPIKPSINDKTTAAAWYIAHSKESPIERDRKLLSKYAKKGQVFIAKTESVISQDSSPPFYKIKHCSECQFKTSCYEKLKQKDCISLLAGMTPKVLAKYHKKGITTITQLSHLFRPRRSNRTLHTTGRYFYELKALAIRERKTFVLQTPDGIDSPNAIYIDFEGIPDEKSYYLLGGMIYVRGELKEMFSIWSDEKEQEQDSFTKLFDLFKKYPDAIIYHYGSYEGKAIQKAVKESNKKLAQEWMSIEKRMVNLLSYFRTHVYPPTYGNGLKEIGKFLGFEWSESDIDGAKSIELRKEWEHTKSDTIKQKLLQYNLDDCKALSKVHQWLSYLSAGAEEDSIQQVAKMKRHSPYRWQSNDRFGEDFNFINKAAYFNYQRSKIYWRNEPKKQSPKATPLTRKPATIGRGMMAWQPKKINEIITAQPIKKCSKCGHRKLYQSARKQSLTQTDLKFTSSGIRRHVIEYRTAYSTCAKCRRRESNKSLRMLRYGDNLFALVINYYVKYRLSNEMISKIIQEHYGIWVSPMYLVMQKNEWWTRTWQEEADYIKQIVFHSPVIHIDETPFKLSKESGYVWVFATSHSVFYHYTKTRSIDFLNDWLKGYKGIIISDFFPGYETLNVKRQKCLIHLIRDLNDDLFKNPFDEEFKVLVRSFNILLKAIIETIDKYGLKKIKLEKHVKHTEDFYNKFIDCEHKSELSIHYTKRIKKHWDQLWTFLHHDNVPWNNNNAEAGIKAVAHHRRLIKGVMHERGLRDYLQMLSIAQTCRYRNISFLGFLRRKKGIWENIPEDALPGFLPFNQARQYVRKMGFERKREWEKWRNAKKRPSFIPYSPHLNYRSKGWSGWHDWVGFSYLPFEKARTIMRKLHLKNREAYLRWSASDKRPKTIPASPEKVYRHTGWIDLSDWLGTKNAGRKKKKRLPYEQAKAYVQSIGLKTQNDFFKWRKSGNRPDTIPADPERVYVEFQSWGEFLGTNRIANQDKEYLSYEDAKEAIKEFQIESVHQYRELFELGLIPIEIPKNPYAFYKKEGSWVSFTDFWSKPRLEKDE